MNQENQKLPRQGIRLTDVSRVVSHALRHEPWLYELELDEDGWTSIEDLLAALRLERPAWSGLNESDLERMMAEATKKRCELGGGRIRALYGHSLPGRLNKSPAKPPEVLYHGTAPRTLQKIRQGGLLPMRRQYVHLSIDTGTATEVGRRKAQVPVVLRILASEAHAAGVRFYAGNDKVWLADSVPAHFVVEPETSGSAVDMLH